MKELTRVAPPSPVQRAATFLIKVCACSADCNSGIGSFIYLMLLKFWRILRSLLLCLSKLKYFLELKCINLGNSVHIEQVL